jgi:hypothetical protein
MKILPVGVELYLCEQMDGRMDRRTHMTNLTVAFRNFANAPRNEVTANMSINRCTCLQYASQRNVPLISKLN